MEEEGQHDSVVERTSSCGLADVQKGKGVD